MTQTYPINIWINEKRYEKLVQAGLSNMTKEVLAGMKVLQIQCTEKQKNKIMKLYPTAKFDSATTESIELLPAAVKNEILDLAIREKSLDIVEKFLRKEKTLRHDSDRRGGKTNK